MAYRRIQRWFNIHDEEIGLFVWTVALLFLVRSSGILLNNYAETAFLKRYGVEYMPIVNMVNAVLTFFVMGVMTGFMARLPGARLLSRLFVFCGISVAMIRAIIPWGIDMIYPALFMLKSQYEVLLALLFWNLANDLFTTRQSKRLFPLITAGGVVGQILGSFVTPVVAHRLHMDNLLLIYSGTAIAGAWAVRAMGKRYPTLLFQKKSEGENKKRASIIQEFKTVLPLVKSSLLFKLLVVLTFMPNVVIPIMNYQFNFAVDDQFSTESGLIEFFSYFRGVLNIVSLVILLFVGKLYDRFGLPVALMFHPFNYMLVFITFLLRFDAFSAMYARMSSNIIRTTINLPATAIVTGLFPESYRAMVRPFLRGTVVRIGLFLGSGLILFSENLFHPRYLSLVAMPFVIAWIVAPFIIKRRYADILIDLISEDRIDFRTMNAAELNQVFRDRRVQDLLLKRLYNDAGENRLWYAQLLSSIRLPDLDAHLLAVLHDEDPQTQIGLIRLLSDRAGPMALDRFDESIERAEPALAIAMIDAGHRMSPTLFEPVYRRIVQSDLPLSVRAHAVGSLFTLDPDRYGLMIGNWLASHGENARRAGIIAAGISRDRRFAEPLKSLLTIPDDDTLLLVLDSLRTIPAVGLNALVAPRLNDHDPKMRHAVLSLFQIEDESTLKQVIPLLGDSTREIADLARKKIRTADYENSLRLIKSLSLPQRKVRESLFELLAEMSIKDLEIYRFVRLQAKLCYQMTIQSQNLSQLPDSPYQKLLIIHLQERVRFSLATILRVLAAQDSSGKMHAVIRGVFSSDKRRRANGLEAMGDILETGIFQLLAPFFDDTDAMDRIAAGQRFFPNELTPLSDLELIGSLLESRSWVTRLLTLKVMGSLPISSVVAERIQPFVKDENRHVSAAAQKRLMQIQKIPSDQEMTMEKETTIALTDKILYLRNIEIFSGLSINELAAVASVTEESVFGEQELVFCEGDHGDTLFLVVEGDVAVIKDRSGGGTIELDSIGAGDYFGEMALFGDDRRSATIRVKTAARFLTLRKEELQEIVREFPQIALHVCRVLSMRIRHLHGKISEYSC